MSQQGVEKALGKLVTDAGFRSRFFQDPAGVSTSAGLELSAVELKALARVPPTAINRLSLFLDARIARPPLDGPAVPGEAAE